MERAQLSETFRDKKLIKIRIFVKLFASIESTVFQIWDTFQVATCFSLADTNRTDE